MTSGRLAVSNPPTATQTQIYMVPAGTLASINISVVNTSINAEKITIYISDSSSVSNAKILEYMTTISGNGGVLEREGLLLTEGERVIVVCSSNVFSIRIHGFED